MTKQMKESEIDEVREAIAIIHHLTDDEPLTGWKYDMMKAVLPLLERQQVYANFHIEDFTIDDVALSIARVINHKRPNTIENTETARAKTRKAKANLKPRKPPVLSKDKIVELKAQGRIIEKNDQ